LNHFGFSRAKAVEKDKQRVKLAPEDKLYNKLIQHEMEFSPVVDYWERNGAEYARKLFNFKDNDRCNC